MNVIKDAGKQLSRAAKDAVDKAGSVAKLTVEIFNDSNQTIQFTGDGQSTTVAAGGKSHIKVGLGPHSFRVSINGESKDSCSENIIKNRCVHFDGNRLTQWN